MLLTDWRALPDRQRYEDHTGRYLLYQAVDGPRRIQLDIVGQRLDDALRSALAPDVRNALQIAVDSVREIARRKRGDYRQALTDLNWQDDAA